MSGTGSILIEKLDIYAYHGWHGEEGRLGQRFSLDLLLETDLRASAASDRLEDTVDYSRVIAEVSESFITNRFNLLEAAARHVALLILNGFPAIGRVTVTLRKPSPPIPASLASVGVTLSVGRGEIGA